jgi:anti-sigma regulatory factor (Ser/Thr protein kinase)
MHAETAKLPEAIRFHRSYPGRDDQVRQVRADLASLVAGSPVADDFILLASEVVTNAIVHSRSGLPDGVFTVRAEVHPDDFAWLEVEDQGGPWIEPATPDEEHGRGLALVAALAGDGNWTVEDGSTPGTRVVWVWLDWPTAR